MAGLLPVRVTSVTTINQPLAALRLYLDLYSYFRIKCCFSDHRNPPLRKPWSPVCSPHKNRTKVPDSNAAVNPTYTREIREKQTNTCCEENWCTITWFFDFDFYQRQSSSGTQLGDSRRKTDGASAGPEEHVSASTSVPPAYPKRHFQSVDLNLDYMSVKGHVKPGNASVLRRKWSASLCIDWNKYMHQFIYTRTRQPVSTNKHIKEKY